VRGRKPIPTRIKKLAGTYRPSDGNEPQPEPGMPTAPAHLDELAREEWNRLAQELFKLGLLTGCDRATLAAYCVCYSRWVTAEKELQAGGVIYRTAAGQPAISPWHSVAKNALAQLRGFATELGLSPSARSRIDVEPPQEEDNWQRLWDERLARSHDSEDDQDDESDDELGDCADELVPPEEITTTTTET
jgi:P27 family predicted phage terminase small subunit